MEVARLSCNILPGFEVRDEEWREHRLSDEEFLEKARAFLEDSCLPFKKPDK